jgi:hypothetical protein
VLARSLAYLLTSTDTAVSVVQYQVAVESPIFIAAELVIAQVALLARTDMAAVASVLDRISHLAAGRVLLTAARILAV